MWLNLINGGDLSSLGGRHSDNEHVIYSELKQGFNKIVIIVLAISLTFIMIPKLIWEDKKLKKIRKSENGDLLY